MRIVEAEPLWMSNENPEPSMETWDTPPHEQHFSLHMVKDCGNLTCSGMCDHCLVAESYAKQLDIVHRECRIIQAKELGFDSDSVMCSCQECSLEMRELSHEDMVEWYPLEVA